MNDRAEKLAAALDSRVVRNWVHSTGTSPKATGFKHDAECQQAAALIRRQAEQIRELREALQALYVAAPISLECHSFHHSKGEQHSHTQECKPKSAYLEALAASAAALSNTKEET